MSKLDHDQQSLASIEAQIVAARAKLDMLAAKARAVENRGQNSKFHRDLIGLYQRNLATLQEYKIVLEKLIRERQHSPWIGGP